MDEPEPKEKPIVKNNFINENISSTSDLQSSEHYDYLEDVDSPISTDSDIDNFFDFYDNQDQKSKEDDTSINDTETQYQKTFEKFEEEEKKLSNNESPSSAKSERRIKMKRKDTQNLESNNYKGNKSVRNKLKSKKLSKNSSKSPYRKEVNHKSL